MQLSCILKTAWTAITTTFELDSETHYTTPVVQNTTGVVFFEGLLRSILDLRAPQQLSLVQQLANEVCLIITRGGTDDTLYRSNTNVRTSASNNPDAPPDIPFKTPTVLIYEALKAQGLDDSASLHRAMIIRGTVVCIDPDCRDCATFTEGAYAV